MLTRLYTFRLAQQLGYDLLAKLFVWYLYMVDVCYVT